MKKLEDTFFRELRSSVLKTRLEKQQGMAN
jgi:hypothetical protein